MEKKEYDYASCYNILVRNKEKQLKKLIDEITLRYDDKKLHDKKMHGLEMKLADMRKEETLNEHVRHNLRKELE